MKHKHENNNTSTGLQAESGHQESEALTLGTGPSSPCLIEPKNLKMSPEPEPRELSVEMEQFARLLDLDLRAETYDGILGCVKGTSWLRAVERADTTLGLTADMASFLFPSDETFMEHMLTILLEEASAGRHTQQSLDQAMGLCEKLIPNRSGWVDARALHIFLEEVQNFPGWCESLAYFVKLLSPEDCRHTSIDAALNDCNIEGAKRAPRPFKVNTHLAFKIALASQTRRGSLLRDVYLTIERVARLPNKIYLEL
jgi:hypothetical protein